MSTKLQNCEWVECPFQVQDRSKHFDVTEPEIFTDFILQLHRKKLSLVDRSVVSKRNTHNY